MGSLQDKDIFRLNMLLNDSVHYWCYIKSMRDEGIMAELWWNDADRKHRNYQENNLLHSYFDVKFTRSGIEHWRQRWEVGTVTRPDNDIAATHTRFFILNHQVCIDVLVSDQRQLINFLCWFVIRINKLSESKGRKILICPRNLHIEKLRNLSYL
jgi:hypothetical protein